MFVGFGRSMKGGQPEMAVPLEKFLAAPLGLGEIFYDLLPQHWRAGLNSSAARRAWDPHVFGHWSWLGLGSGGQPEMAVPLLFFALGRK